MKAPIHEKMVVIETGPQNLCCVRWAPSQLLVPHVKTVPHGCGQSAGCQDSPQGWEYGHDQEGTGWDHHVRIPSLKTHSCHHANFVITGGTSDCRYDNHWCHQWWRMGPPYQDSFSENTQLSPCQLCHHWWHQRLSLWQPLVPPVMTNGATTSGFLLWKHRVVSMPTLSSLVAPAVVVTTTTGATGDDEWDHHIMIPSLKTQSCHHANFFITGGISGCHNDNHWCHQWWQKLASWGLKFSFNCNTVKYNISIHIWRVKPKFYPKHLSHVV